jgi:hypothetical protein
MILLKKNSRSYGRESREVHHLFLVLQRQAYLGYPLLRFVIEWSVYAPQFTSLDWSSRFFAASTACASSSFMTKLTVRDRSYHGQVRKVL